MTRKKHPLEQEFADRLQDVARQTALQMVDAAAVLRDLSGGRARLETILFDILLGVIGVTSIGITRGDYRKAMDVNDELHKAVAEAMNESAAVAASIAKSEDEQEKDPRLH